MLTRADFPGGSGPAACIIRAPLPEGRAQPAAGGRRRGGRGANAAPPSRWVSPAGAAPCGAASHPGPRRQALASGGAAGSCRAVFLVAPGRAHARRLVAVSSGRCSAACAERRSGAHWASRAGFSEGDALPTGCRRREQRCFLRRVRGSARLCGSAPSAPTASAVLGHPRPSSPRPQDSTPGEGLGPTGPSSGGHRPSGQQQLEIPRRVCRPARSAPTSSPPGQTRAGRGAPSRGDGVTG